jgi:hypothetical protein
MLPPVFAPLIQVHIPVLGLNSQRSLKRPGRSGLFPYTPVVIPETKGMFDPFTHVQSPLLGLYFQRSLNTDGANQYAVPMPPNSHRLPSRSIQETAASRAQQPKIAPAVNP